MRCHRWDARDEVKGAQSDAVSVWASATMRDAVSAPVPANIYIEAASIAVAWNIERGLAEPASALLSDRTHSGTTASIQAPSEGSSCARHVMARQRNRSATPHDAPGARQIRLRVQGVGYRAPASGTPRGGGPRRWHRWLVPRPNRARPAPGLHHPVRAPGA